MGDFHCPVGAPVFQGMGCIECRLCQARTKAEVAAATEIVGAYIRSTAGERLEGKKIRKIAVCGKGGSGKSTVAALLANSLVTLGYRPLLIDTDDSNDGTASKIGIDDLPSPLMEGLPRFSPDGEGDMTWLAKDPLAIEEIPRRFTVEKDGILFMTIGKIENPLQGCSCNFGELTKTLMLNLDPGERNIVVADQDAGVESFGRGVERGCDTVLITIEPSRDSLLLAEKLKRLSEGLGIRRIRVVMNKVRSKKEFKYLRGYLAERDIRWIGCLYEDDDVAMANLMGERLSTAGKMQHEMDRIATFLLDEAEMGHLNLPI